MDSKIQLLAKIVLNNAPFAQSKPIRLTAGREMFFGKLRESAPAGFWYVLMDGPPDPSCVDLSKLCGEMMKSGVRLFSPQLHSYPLRCFAGRLSDFGSELFCDHYEPIFAAAYGILVIRPTDMPANIEPNAIIAEIRKPVIYVEAWQV